MFGFRRGFLNSGRGEGDERDHSNDRPSSNDPDDEPPGLIDEDEGSDDEWSTVSEDKEEQLETKKRVHKTDGTIPHRSSVRSSFLHAPNESTTYSSNRLETTTESADSDLPELISEEDGSDSAPGLTDSEDEDFDEGYCEECGCYHGREEDFYDDEDEEYDDEDEEEDEENDEEEDDDDYRNRSSYLHPLFSSHQDEESIIQEQGIGLCSSNGRLNLYASDDNWYQRKTMEERVREANRSIIFNKQEVISYVYNAKLTSLSLALMVLIYYYQMAQPTLSQETNLPTWQQRNIRRRRPQLRQHQEASRFRFDFNNLTTNPFQ